MTEPERFSEKTQTTQPAGSAGAESRPFESEMDVGGRSWVVVELQDHESWDLFAGTSHDRGARLAHIRVTDGGYFSTDRAGTVRGPYVTLSEATYPLGLDDPLLLEDAQRDSRKEAEGR